MKKRFAALSMGVLGGLILALTGCAAGPPAAETRASASEELLPAGRTTGALAVETVTPPGQARPTRTLVATSSVPTAAARLQPYPFTTPLPPPTATVLDGLYTKTVRFPGTPVPCRRCAPYRANGGTWTIELKQGAYRIWHESTDFTGVGSFTVQADRLTLFNDPNCHLDVGTYTWARHGRELVLQAQADSCAWGLRAANLSRGAWTMQADATGVSIDPCQPPSLEAAITGHWPVPENCDLVQP
ncbi:MAG TPA: hypothetical protein PKE64_24945 [Anaerolineae bacterium]|nr:hypothetical protein [Anaerolineae bacterium]HMR67272.1 hypothetical protein [Anaerolineae bacterium]